MFTLFLSSVFAENAIDLSLTKYGQVQTSNPAIELTFNETADEFNLQLKCGSKRFNKSATLISQGQKFKIELPISAGKAKCTGTLEAVFDENNAGSMPVNFAIEMLNALNISVDRARVDLEKRTLSVKIDRPAAHYEVELLDVDQKRISSGSTSVSKAQNLSAQTISWDAASGEVAIIRVKAKDVHGFSGYTDLLPWNYDIPHEDVIFESNKAEILPAEEPKLVAVKKEVDAVFKKYEKIAKANLYVAGYTDTVGSAATNLALSKKRAKAIAIWFQKQGFGGKIYYQGFGEGALAVPTADGVDQAENRRALYIVAAETPNRSKDLPKSNWTLLR